MGINKFEFAKICDRVSKDLRSKKWWDPKPTTFKMFVEQCYGTRIFFETPEGDFIDDFYEDCISKNKFPDFKSEKALVKYMEVSSWSCDAAIDAAKNIFRIWKLTHGSVSLTSHEKENSKIGRARSA